MIVTGGNDQQFLDSVEMLTETGWQKGHNNFLTFLFFGKYQTNNFEHVGIHSINF